MARGGGYLLCFFIFTFIYSQTGRFPNYFAEIHSFKSLIPFEFRGLKIVYYNHRRTKSSEQCYSIAVHDIGLLPELSTLFR